MEQYEVLLFVPNIIDYVRILLLFTAFYHMLHGPVIGSLCYFSSVLLDEIDGYAARLFDQCSRFGNLLDMLIDRVGAVGLLTVLSMLYPRWALLFQISTALDITSHWMHFYSTTALMKSETHRTADLSHPLLKLYYTNKPFLSFMCIGNEAFYVLLYLRYFMPGQFGDPFISVGLFEVLLYLFFPVAVGKTYISCVQLQEAVWMITSVDMKERKQAHIRKS